MEAAQTSRAVSRADHLVKHVVPGTAFLLLRVASKGDSHPSSGKWAHPTSEKTILVRTPNLRRAIMWLHDIAGDKWRSPLSKDGKKIARTMERYTSFSHHCLFRLGVAEDLDAQIVPLILRYHQINEEEQVLHTEWIPTCESLSHYLISISCVSQPSWESPQID